MALVRVALPVLVARRKPSSDRVILRLPPVDPVVVTHERSSSARLEAPTNGFDKAVVTLTVKLPGQSGFLKRIRV